MQVSRLLRKILGKILGELRAVLDAAGVESA